MNLKKFLRLADALLIALVITALAATDWADEFDNIFSDKFYQHAGEKNPDIIVVGIDLRTLNTLGTLESIKRRDIAQVIDFLNRDPNARPAVIGLDILFTGKNLSDPEGDKLLVESAAKFGNVVVGSEADITDDLADETPWAQSWPFIPPFTELANVVETGHIDAPNEIDGIARHELLFINVEEHGKLYSFARVIYEKFCRTKGIEPNPLPTTYHDGIFYLPFTAKTYAGKINFLDLLEGRDSPPVKFRDKIILIGPYAPGKDDSQTALDRSSWMYGVDIHANAIQAFMDDDCPCDASKFPQLIILFAATFLSGYYFRNAKMCHITLWWLMACFGWLLMCQIYRCNGLILHVSWIPISETILFVGSVAINYASARAENDRVTATFERYVDPVVMRKLLSDGSKLPNLGGELKDIAVLFVDIRGFTSMSEELPPATVVEILNRYLTLTTNCIRLYHGTLDKFVGDCTMAFWNAPVPQEKPVLLACRAALDMIAGSELLGKELMARYGRKISFGVGINWGSAVVGNIGTDFRMDYTAIGDTVNTAARLEANARGGTILISRAVADMLGDCADVTSLGNSIKLKGKSPDFEVLVLNSLNDKGV